MRLKMKKIAIILTPIVLLVLGFVTMRVLSSFKEEKPKRSVPIQPRIVETSVVELEEVSARLVTYGTLASRQPVNLIAEVSGTIMEGDIPFQPAQSFRKGDLLLMVDDRQVNLELNSTKSDLMTALSSLMPEIKVGSPEIYQRWQSYFDGIAFDRPLAELPTVTDQRIKSLLARYNIYKLYFSVRSLEIRAAKHRFIAPFNGSILSTQSRPGSVASPGTRLGEIINLDELEVEVKIPAQDVRWITIGSAALLIADNGASSWSGTMSRIGNAIDERSQSIPAYIRLSDDSEIKPIIGSFLEIQIAARVIPNAIEVPRKAVYEESYVYLIEDGMLTETPVGIGFDEGEFYVITDGLSNGDTLVTQLLQGVSSGMPAIPASTQTD